MSCSTFHLVCVDGFAVGRPNYNNHIAKFTQTEALQLYIFILRSIQIAMERGGKTQCLCYGWVVLLSTTCVHRWCWVDFNCFSKSWFLLINRMHRYNNMCYSSASTQCLFSFFPSFCWANGLFEFAGSVNQNDDNYTFRLFSIWGSYIYLTMQLI